MVNNIYINLLNIFIKYQYIHIYDIIFFIKKESENNEVLYKTLYNKLIYHDEIFILYDAGIHFKIDKRKIIFLLRKEKLNNILEI